MPGLTLLKRAVRILDELLSCRAYAKCPSLELLLQILETELKGLEVQAIGVRGHVS